MDNYIKTIINGLKSWVTSCLSRLESSVSGSLATMADKLTSLSSKVTKNAKDIAQLQAYEDETNALATQAQTTANQAQTTAQSAQTTANQAMPRTGGNFTGDVSMCGNVAITRDGAIISRGVISVTGGGSYGAFQIAKGIGTKTKFLVSRDSETNVSAPSTIEFTANGSASMNLEGINVIQMKSPSGKKFNITVSDDGTLTTTEVTT